MDIEFASGTPMTEGDIQAAAAYELTDSARYTSSELTKNWAQAYGYYKGELPGRSEFTSSQVISPDVSDAIEWVLPAILKPLVESPDVVRFDPVTPEDEDQASLESDYAHYVFMKQCRGFEKAYVHIKDALMLKVGVFATYWDDGVENQLEEYEDLTAAELADLLFPGNDTEAKLLSSTSRQAPVIDAMTGEPLPPPPGPPDPATGQPGPPTEPAPMETVYNAKIRRFTPKGKPVVENCKPEAFKVRMSHNSIDLDGARYCSYSIRKTRAEVYSMGFPKDKVAGIAAASDYGYDDEVIDAREDVEEDYTGGYGEENETGDPSQDMLDIHRVYMTLDVDGDGYEERYLILLAGRQGETMLEYYEVPENPFSASTPFIAGHKFYGYSIYDKLVELARHKTKVLRMLEDNLDLVNNPRKNVLRGQVTVGDIFLQAPGVVRRMDTPGAIEEVPTPPMAAQAFQMLEYYDKMRAERVGIDPNAQAASGMMPDESMNATMDRVLTMKDEVVDLMIRVFAETGFKSMFLKIRGLMMRHNPREQLVQLRNKWVELDPGNWVERTGTTVKVGLGTGDRMKKTQGLLQTYEMQRQQQEMGMTGLLVSPERVQYTASELIRVQGLGDPDDFWLDPKLLSDPRNAETPRGQETMRALQLREEQQQQASQAQQAEQQAAAQQQEALLNLQREVAQVQAQAKAFEAQTKAQTADKDRVAEMQQFMREQRLAWAELVAEVQSDRAKNAATIGTALVQQGAQVEAAKVQAEAKPEPKKTGDDK